jgi:hypothetical protein
MKDVGRGFFHHHTVCRNIPRGMVEGEATINLGSFVFAGRISDQDI